MSGLLEGAGRELTAALRFLTRLPAGGETGGRSFGAAAFPVVGLLLGAGALAVDAILTLLLPSVRHVGVVTFLALATGALHHDGLADTADALGGRDREGRLRIMRESTIGAFGVLAVVLALAAKLAALAALGGGLGLVLAPAIGRWTMLVSALGMPAARSDGLGAGFVETLEPAPVAAATLITVAAATALGGWAGLMACLSAAGVAAGVRRLALARFGGVTGDVLGAAGEVAETLALAVLASSVRSTGGPP